MDNNNTYKGILEEESSDTVSVKSINSNNKSIDSLSKYLCIANKPLYFLGLAVSLVVTLLLIYNFNINFYLLYIFGATCFIATTIVAYLVGRYFKVKKDTLDLHQVNGFKKVAFIGITIFIGILVSVVMAVIVAYADKDKYILNDSEYKIAIEQEQSELNNRNNNSGVKSGELAGKDEKQK